MLRAGGREPYGYGSRAEILEELGGDTIQEGVPPARFTWSRVAPVRIPIGGPAKREPAW